MCYHPRQCGEDWWRQQFEAWCPVVADGVIWHFLHLKHSFWQCRDIETLPLCLTGLWWENTGDNQWGFQLWADLFTRFKSSQADLLFTRFIWCHIYLNAVSRILLQWASRREWAGRLQSVNQHFIQLSALYQSILSSVRVVRQLYFNQSCSWIVTCAVMTCLLDCCRYTSSERDLSTWTWRQRLRNRWRS